MLVIPSTSPTEACIIGIDPGTDTLGVAVLCFDIMTMEPTSLELETLVASRGARRSWESELYGDKYGRLHYLGNELFSRFEARNPFQVVSEAPFMGRFASAVIALTENVMVIRAALFEHNPLKVLQMIDPPTVKMAVGAPGGSKDKTLVRDGLIKLLGHVYVGTTPMLEVSEHASDSGAVAYCQFLRLRQEAGYV